MSTQTKADYCATQRHFAREYNHNDKSLSGPFRNDLVESFAIRYWVASPPDLTNEIAVIAPLAVMAPVAAIAPDAIAPLTCIFRLASSSRSPPF